MAAYLVTSATGKQGGSVVDELLAANQSVRAWTRNASSPASQALKARGVEVFQGEYSDHEALTAAARGCAGVFMNVSPQFTSMTGELEDGQAIVAAAKAAGIKHMVYASSTIDNGKEDALNYAEPGSFRWYYIKNKRTLEEETRKFERWTVLKPSGFMTNFCGPDAQWMFPKLSKDGSLQSAYEDRITMYLINPFDVGKFVAAAFLEPEKFHGQNISLAVEAKNMPSIAEELSNVSGKKVTAVTYTEEEIKQSLLAQAQTTINKMPLTVDIDQAKSWGIPMTSFREFLEARKEQLVEGVGSK